LLYVFRVPPGRRIDGLPQRQQDWVWNIVALVIIAVVLIGVPLIYAVLGFGTGSSYSNWVNGGYLGRSRRRPHRTV
jgi:hypothetical protein